MPKLTGTIKKLTGCCALIDITTQSHGIPSSYMNHEYPGIPYYRIPRHCISNCKSIQLGQSVQFNRPKGMWK